MTLPLNLILPPTVASWVALLDQSVLHGHPWLMDSLLALVAVPVRWNIIGRMVSITGAFATLVRRFRRRSLQSREPERTNSIGWPLVVCICIAVAVCSREWTLGSDEREEDMLLQLAAMQRQLDALISQQNELGRKFNELIDRLSLGSGGTCGVSP